MKFNSNTIVWQQKPDFFRPLDNANPVPGKDLVETDVSGLGFRGEAVDVHVTQRKPSLVLRDDRETGTHDPGGGNPEGLPHSLAEHRLARPEVARERHHVSRARAGGGAPAREPGAPGAGTRSWAHDRCAWYRGPLGDAGSCPKRGTFLMYLRDAEEECPRPFRHSSSAGSPSVCWSASRMFSMTSVAETVDIGWRRTRMSAESPWRKTPAQAA